MANLGYNSDFGHGHGVCGHEASAQDLRILRCVAGGEREPRFAGFSSLV